MLIRLTTRPTAADIPIVGRPALETEVVERGKVNKSSTILLQSELISVRKRPRLDITPGSGHGIIINTALDSALLLRVSRFS